MAIEFGFIFSIVVIYQSIKREALIQNSNQIQNGSKNASLQLSLSAAAGGITCCVLLGTYSTIMPDYHRQAVLMAREKEEHSCAGGLI